jgi:hypothetical protein
MLSKHKFSLVGAFIAAAVIAGCGSSSSSQSGAAPAGGSTPGGSSHQATGGSSGQASGALSADATSAATGDIPDTQAYLVFTNQAAGYSIKYPEGWAQSGSGGHVTFHDKNNLVRVLIASGPPPTPASVATQLRGLKQSDPTLNFRPPEAVSVGSSPAVKAVYTTTSAPNPVTGKRVQLIVDRYELARGGRVATVDLGTPKGVDNVDAYRMMIQSFRWL